MRMPSIVINRVSVPGIEGGYSAIDLIGKFSWIALSACQGELIALIFSK